MQHSDDHLPIESVSWLYWRQNVRQPHAKMINLINLNLFVFRVIEKTVLASISRGRLKFKWKHRQATELTPNAEMFSLQSRGSALRRGKFIKNEPQSFRNLSRHFTESLRSSTTTKNFLFMLAVLRERLIKVTASLSSSFFSATFYDQSTQWQFLCWKGKSFRRVYRESRQEKNYITFMEIVQ